jgi:hypothetical protein
MWPVKFEDRLIQWSSLREEAKNLSLESSLNKINHWWQQTPWSPYHLHWDDQETWPNPWELLSDNLFCDLARSLGIVYTTMMIDHPDIDKIELASCDETNLVLINQGKYILNWSPEELLNISTANIKIKKTLDSEKVRYLIG